LSGKPGSPSEALILDQDRLPLSGKTREFEGDDYGNAGVSFILVDAPPGGGPSLHRHPYAEVFVVQQGRATFFLDDEQHEVRAGQIIVVPAGRAHRFVNSGDEPLRQLDIHASPHFITEWLEGAQG
jgi:mannose-6-phosphate isomerase-like protein (cupin superfamily)